MSKMANVLENYHAEMYEINKELQTLPEGYLNKRHTSYYHATKAKQVGISKKPQLVQQLCRKRYLATRLAQLENNIVATQVAALDTRTPRQLITTLPKAYQSVPESHFYHPSIPAWQAKQPRKNTLYPENAKYIYNDIAYRSLAERIIAEIIDKNGLFFQYDHTFDTGHAQVSPDFVIKNPFTAKTFICEYFGAFDKPTYGTAMNNKLDNYAKVGFIQNENLMALYEYHIRKPQRIQDIIDKMLYL